MNVPRSKKRVRQHATADRARVDALVTEVERLRAQLEQTHTLQTVLEALVATLDRGGPKKTTPEARQNAESQWPIYLKEWRRSRRRSLDDLSKAIGLTKSQLSRVENGLQAYTRRILEGYANVLGCRPADLLSHAPYAPEQALMPLFTQLGAGAPTTQSPAVFVEPKDEEVG